MLYYLKELFLDLLFFFKHSSTLTLLKYIVGTILIALPPTLIIITSYFTNNTAMLVFACTLLVLLLLAYAVGLSRFYIGVMQQQGQAAEEIELRPLSPLDLSDMNQDQQGEETHLDGPVADDGLASSGGSVKGDEL